MSKLVQKSEIHFSVISPSEKREQEAIKEAERKAELARAEAKRRAAQKAAEAREKANEAAKLAAKNKAQSIKRKKTIYTLLGVIATIVIILSCIKLWLFLYEWIPALPIIFSPVVLFGLSMLISVMWLEINEKKDKIK